jgi:hypothetical protein
MKKMLALKTLTKIQNSFVSLTKLKAALLTNLALTVRARISFLNITITKSMEK